MDITVYLPDELGQWAKANDVNLSRMLRDAVTEEQMQRTAIEATSATATEHKLDIEGDEGAYTLRFTGTRIAEDRDVEVYLTDDEDVLVYEADKERYSILTDVEDLSDRLGQGAYIEAMHALGLKPVVDLRAPVSRQ